MRSGALFWSLSNKSLHLRAQEAPLGVEGDPTGAGEPRRDV